MNNFIDAANVMQNYQKGMLYINDLLQSQEKKKMFMRTVTSKRISILPDIVD